MNNLGEFFLICYTMYSKKRRKVIMITVAVFVGSLREKSTNKMLAKALEDIARDDMEFRHVDIQLPLYSEDIEYAGLPEAVQRAKETVEQADGILFITPEYNRSMPGALKNAIDWVSRPYGKSSFKRKPIGIVGSSIGTIGTALAQADLRRSMLFQDAKVLGQPEIYVMNASEVFDEEGSLVSERWMTNFREYMATFSLWVEKEKE